MIKKRLTYRGLLICTGHLILRRGNDVLWSKKSLRSLPRLSSLSKYWRDDHRGFTLMMEFDNHTLYYYKAPEDNVFRFKCKLPMGWKQMRRADSKYMEDLK